MTKTMRDALKYSERGYTSKAFEQGSWCATAYWMAKVKVAGSGKPTRTMSSAMRALKGYTRRQGRTITFLPATTHPTHVPTTLAYRIKSVVLKSWGPDPRAIAAPILDMFRTDLKADHFRAVASRSGDKQVVAAFKGNVLVGVAAPMRWPE